jgi:prepilin-type N-terminal cleavage/methylation domain-containing protein
MTRRNAFTLIELLIVVAIIAILAAIAVPNFLEAQTRSKVSRVKADMRSLAVAIEAYHVDTNHYPEGTDNPTLYEERIVDFLAPHGLQAGYYGFRTRGAGKVAGRDFYTITTPVAYITSIPTDPFAKQAAGFLTYTYRNAKVGRNGWVLTSFGPDADIFENAGGKLGAGTVNPNPVSTASDLNSPARLGDVNEREVIRMIETGTATVPGASASRLREYLIDLSYDPTNGTVSDGDIIFIGPGVGFPTE